MSKQHKARVVSRTTKKSHGSPTPPEIGLKERVHGRCKFKNVGKLSSAEGVGGSEGCKSGEAEDYETRRAILVRV